MNLQRPIILFFALVLGVYVSLSAGYTDSADVEPSIETARAILERGSLAVATSRSDVNEFLYTKGQNGEYFSKMGLLYPLLYLPAVGFAKLIARGENETRWINFTVSFMNPIFAALAVTLVFAFFIKAGAAPRRAAWIAGSLAFATLWFPYSKSAAREIVQGLLLLMAFYGARFSHVILGASLIAAPFAKEPLLIAMLPAMIMVARREPNSRHQLSKWLIAAAAAAMLATVIYWSVQTGHFRVTGYSSKIWGWCRNTHPWSTGVWKGLFQQWISPERGILLLNPALLLPVTWLAIKVVRRTISDFDTAVLGSIIITSLLHAKWFAPCGDQDLGCRYLIPVLPLFALFLADWTGKPLRLVVIFLIFGLLQQIPNVLVKAQQFWTTQTLAGEPLGISHYQANLVFLKHKLAGKPEIYELSELGLPGSKEISLEPFRSFHGFNLWWLHAIRYRENPSEKSSFR